MKKYLIYSDPHWSQYSSIIRKRGGDYSVRLQNLITSINYVEKFAEDYNCDEIICCGDFFDRQDLNSEEITALQELKFVNNIQHKFIVGNHESNVNNLKYSSTKFFESFNSKVIDNPTREEINDFVDFYFIPYLTTNKCIKLEDYLVDNNKKKIVFAHQDLAGMKYGKFTSQSGFDINDISNNCTLFFDGHLHNNQVINDNIILVGNLTGQNFNEDASKYNHLFYILSISDDGEYSIESFENPYAFNFYKLRIECESDFRRLENLKNNCVLSIVCINTLNNRVEKYLKEHDNVVEYRLVVTYSSLYDGNNNNDILKIEDHFKQFIEFAQTKLESSPILTDELNRLGGN